MGASDGFHGFKVLACVFDSLLRGHELIDIIGEIEHDFAEEHVLESCGSFLWFVLCVISIQCFDKVGECGIEILLFGVELARLHIKTCLEKRRRIHGCSACSSGGKCRATFRCVS